MSLSLPACPPSLKSIQHFLKIAAEHDTRDPVVAYWARLTALQSGLAIDKSSKEALAVLLPLMDWLEKEKGNNKENDAIANEVVASAHLENYAMKLFLAADKQDRAANFGKNVVKMFYSAGVLFDVLETFGELPPEASHYRKYSKMKAAYIHNCLKNGETPVAGPLVEEEDDNNPGEEISIPIPQPHLDQGPGPFVPAPSQHQPQIPNQNYSNVAPPQVVIPSPAPTPSVPASAPTSGYPTLNFDQISKAQKLCKFAISSLDYQDSKSAVENLNKAIYLIQTGQEMQ